MPGGLSAEEEALDLVSACTIQSWHSRDSSACDRSRLNRSSSDFLLSGVHGTGDNDAAVDVAVEAVRAKLGPVAASFLLTALGTALVVLAAAVVVNVVTCWPAVSLALLASDSVLTVKNFIGLAITQEDNDAGDRRLTFALFAADGDADVLSSEPDSVTVTLGSELSGVSDDDVSGSLLVTPDFFPDGISDSS